MIKLLVLSDLHITDSIDVDSSASLISANGSAKNIGEAMFDGLIDTIKNEDIKIDWVVCPGDVGDKVNKVGLEYGWSQLERVRSAIGADDLIGTAGNHDVDSRLTQSEYDPKANIGSLQPLFPGITREDCDKYWARHYCFYEKNGVRFLNVNSSAYHGYSSGTEKPEYMQGRVASSTIADICSDLSKQDFNINVLLTHHHIIKNDHLYDRDNSEMLGAGKLIHQITSATKSPWIVIHGHQHFPEMDYGRGSALAPIVVSTGSFSARLNGTHAAASPNQFYVIEIETINPKLHGWYPCGTVKSWQWSPTKVWERSPMTQRIPYRAGFGSRMNPIQSSSRVEDLLRKAAQPYLELSEVFEAEPLIAFLLPSAIPD